MASKNVLNLLGVISPLDLLKCQTCLKSMEKGEIIEVVLADEDVVENLIQIISRSEDEIIYTKKKNKNISLGIKKGTRNYNGLINKK